MNKAKIKIGFDLDGVILFNPSRVFRSLISKSKQAHLLPRKELEFYHPTSQLEKLLWLLVHKSSFKLAVGFAQLEELALSNQLELYIVSARFACLRSDTQKWQKVIDRNHIFKGIYFNDQDEQPHLFKQKMIKMLDLDIFVEDNWDVVHYLSNNQQKTQVWWLSNLLDQKISYPYKFFSLREIIIKINNLIFKNV